MKWARMSTVDVVLEIDNAGMGSICILIFLDCLEAQHVALDRFHLLGI